MTVYFALATQTGLIKIGCVRRNLERRLQQLQSSRGERVVVLATTHGGRRVEAWWHRRHAATGERHYGKAGPGTGRLTEWFKPSSLLLRDIVDLIGDGARA